MKEDLTTLLDLKGKLLQAQKNFARVLRKRYPFLMRENLEKWKREISSELDFLLSSSVKPKSGRIVIPAPDLGYKKEVVLTRNPGLKYPHESYSAFHLYDVARIDKNDLIVSDRYDKKLPKVHLSKLIDHFQIDQEKLKSFLDFMEEFVKWSRKTKNFLCEGVYDDDDEKYGIKVGEHKITFQAKGFKLKMLVDKREKGYSRWDEIGAFNIKSYRVAEWERFDSDYDGDEEEEDNEEIEKVQIENQSLLLKFLGSFEAFDKVLVSQEAQKKEIVELAKSLFQRLQDFNKPFRVLLKITS